jgi:hypothetical protein
MTKLQLGDIVYFTAYQVDKKFVKFYCKGTITRLPGEVFDKDRNGFTVLTPKVLNTYKVKITEVGNPPISGLKKDAKPYSLLGKHIAKYANELTKDPPKSFVAPKEWIK